MKDLGHGGIRHGTAGLGKALLGLARRDMGPLVGRTLKLIDQFFAVTTSSQIGLWPAAARLG